MTSSTNANGRGHAITGPGLLTYVILLAGVTDIPLMLWLSGVLTISESLITAIAAAALTAGLLFTFREMHGTARTGENEF